LERNELRGLIEFCSENLNRTARMTKLDAEAARTHDISPHKIKFATTIRRIVAQLEKERNQIHSIPRLYRQHQIKRRRLYDVTNVFTAIGCASRSGTDDIRWDGVREILPRLKSEKEKLEVTKYEIPLSALFPLDNCVDLPSLTISFLMLFVAIDSNVLSMRDASAFFSRDTQRYKTTLSKLYQITLILGALEITERTENPGEVRLKPPFDEILCDKEEENPLAIENLLNRPIHRADALEARRADFRATGATGDGA
jgi:hypothetical protein